jgi:hypothetical protein
MSRLSSGVGSVGYEAESVCRRVQEERPSCSTSGGQSSGRGGAWAWFWTEDWKGDWGWARVLAERVLVDFLVWDAHSAKEVQDRQLFKEFESLFLRGLSNEEDWTEQKGVLTVYHLFPERHLWGISLGWKQG